MNPIIRPALKRLDYAITIVTDVMIILVACNLPGGRKRPKACVRACVRIRTQDATSTKATEPLSQSSLLSTRLRSLGQR